jgi:hypothetical protein
MTPPDHCVGPPWPPPLHAYDYLSTITWRDWAWEGLRRNRIYQADALAQPSEGHTSKQLGGGALLTRMQEPVLPAEAWALCSFRQPAPDRLASSSRLAARGRDVSVPGHSWAGWAPIR